MNYTNYKAEDFATDESFLAWFYGEDQESVGRWNAWMSQHPEKQPEVELAIRMISLLQSSSRQPSDSETAQAETRLLAAINGWEAAQRPVISLSHRRSFLWRSMAAAVTLVLLAASAYWWFRQPLAYETAYGQIRSVTLPDGSRVTLNGHSRLTLSRGWTDGTDREVSLEGEGYFQVKKTRQKNRFTVHTGKLDVEVLGTSFNVISRKYKTNVALQEGSIRVKSSIRKEDILMVPGEVVELVHPKELTKKKANPEHYRAWTARKLVFEGTTLREVAQIIEENYGKRVVFQDKSVADKQLSGVVPSDSLEGLLEVLASTFNLDIAQQHDLVLVKAK